MSLKEARNKWISQNELTESNSVAQAPEEVRSVTKDAFTNLLDGLEDDMEKEQDDKKDLIPEFAEENADDLDF